MNEIEVTQLLNRISEINTFIDTLQIEKAERLAEIMPDEVKQAIADLDAEFDEKIALGTEQVNDLRKHVIDGVKEIGESVKGDHLHAVFSKRTSWDGKKLEGFFEVFKDTDVNDFRKVTQSVSIRPVKGSK